VVFAVPHRHLGEDVAAAVVLRPGASLEEKAAREYVAGALAEFKVPRRVLFLNALPKGPTGKLQRIGLAARLGLDENGERGG
jgi:acyl-CoA synthetase (AMP-forming)/AMP-acid ligase II